MGEPMTVQETFSYLSKQFGVLNIKQLGELSPLKDDIVSTGIMGLDIALGVGGIKKGVLLRFMHQRVQERQHLHCRCVSSTRKINRYCT